MRWLIVEDSLESRQGHWFEYLQDFCRELPRLGDEVTLLVSRRAAPFIQSQLGGVPCLPESAFGKMSDNAPAWRRYARIPVHAWKTFWTVRKHLQAARGPDVIFVPTVIVHHLLAWTMLVKFGLKRGNSRVLLFFPGLPIRRTEDAVELDGSPTSKLVKRLMRWQEPEIRAGKVILGVETQAMKQAAEKVFNLPFTYFPHPVSPTPVHCRATGLTMACYGAARHEKGSEILAAAMQHYLERFPASHARFVLQWLEDFITTSGATACLPEALRQQTRTEIVSRFFADGEYTQRLTATQVLLLPYRCSSYGLRVSRVVIEAMVNGIPVVVTRGSTLAQQAEEFGAAELCEDEDVESLVTAIQAVDRNYESLAGKARERQESAREHFSVENFRRLLMAGTAIDDDPKQTT